MEEDEVVNCLCHHPEGDGMMVQVVRLQKLETGSIKFRYLESLQSSVQCEVCLTWQHGACIGVDCEEQVISVDIRFTEEICFFYFPTLPWTFIAYNKIPFDLQVPDNYTCSICRDPPLGRQSALYSIHHEWIRWNSCFIISFALMSSHDLGREACPALPQVHPKMLP